MNPQMAIEHVLHDLPSAATATFLALFPIVNPPTSPAPAEPAISTARPRCYGARRRCCGRGQERAAGIVGWRVGHINVESIT